MSKLESLKSCSSLSDLAHLIGYRPKSLGSIIHQTPDAIKYHNFSIPKRGGGEREISAPFDKLKVVQIRLSDLLYDCQKEINHNRGIESAISHGFRKEYSIFTNAAVHTKKRYVFNTDIADFFPSINLGRVRGFFIKNRNFELEEPVANAIAQICCWQNQLPQGSPCSPVVSNLIGHILDIRLVRLAKSMGCDYSRYADDLTFSTNKLRFPKEIAKSALCDHNEWKVGKSLDRIIRASGFEINAKKTRMQYHTSQQMVTGLVVNSRPNIPTKKYKKIRAMCDHVFWTGSCFEVVNTKKDDGSFFEQKQPVTINSLLGRMEFAFYAKSFGRDPIDFKKVQKPKGYLKLYRDLIFFERCYANNIPLIICEGKTDPVYLKSALKNLNKDFPTLVIKNGENYTYSTRFLNHNKRPSQSLGIFDGADNLISFMFLYRRLMTRYPADKTHFPTIFVTDNDSGVRGKDKLFDKIAKLTKKPCDGSQPFYKILEGLYLVPVPPGTNGKPREIEDLLDPKLKKIKLGTKKLNLKLPFDQKTEYGKALFAEKVVAPKYKTANFDKFKPMFDAIADVIVDAAK